VLRLFSIVFLAMLRCKDGDFGVFNMKHLAIAFALAILTASPALAQYRQTVSPQAGAAQASVPYDRYTPIADHLTVIANGEVLGRDPDPAVRSTLLREGNPSNINGN
jgi:hypothetical protein